LNAFNLDVQPRLRVADHVRTLRAAGKLLTTPGVIPVLAQQGCKLALANLSFLPVVHDSCEFV